MKKQRCPEFQFPIGKCTDNFSELKKKCAKKADEFILSDEVQGIDRFDITFWTGDFPELICVANCRRGEDGKITYRLDDSVCTL